MTTRQFIAGMAVTLVIAVMLGILYVRVNNFAKEIESRIQIAPVTTYGQK